MKTNRRGGVPDKINIPLSGSLANMWQDKKLEWTFPSLRERGGGGIEERNVRNRGPGGRGRVYKRAGSEKNLKL